jgi:hypothetical protein
MDDEEIDSEDLTQDDWRSLEYSRTRGGGDCDDYAIASMAILRNEGYPTKMLYVGARLERFHFEGGGSILLTTGSHYVHLLKVNDRFGINGINPSDRICPEHTSLENLFRTWDYTKNTTGKIPFVILDLDNLDLESSPENLCREIKSQLENVTLNHAK